MKEIIQQKIWDYSDGLLSEREAEEVKKLISTSNEYKSFYAEISAVKDSFSGLRPGRFPDDLSEKIMEAYRAHLVKDLKTSAPGINQRLVKGILFFLAAMPVTVFFIYLIKGGMHFRIRMDGSLTDAIVNNPIVWLLIVFNLMAGVRFMQKRAYLKNSLNI